MTIRRIALTLCTEYRAHIERWASTVAGEAVYLRVPPNELDELRRDVELEDGDQLNLVLQGFRCVYHLVVDPPCAHEPNSMQCEMWTLSGICLDGKSRARRPGSMSVEMFRTAEDLLDELRSH